MCIRDRLYSDYVPPEDDLVVERMQRAGAITIGKTNTPEFGAGSQTFNKVFGATHNPYDLTKTCGGSSGGAAAALAFGFTPIATGSDTGGSLRNPAAFCNVVGFRPSIGRVPSPKAPFGWSTLSTAGSVSYTHLDVYKRQWTARCPRWTGTQLRARYGRGPAEGGGCRLSP